MIKQIKNEPIKMVIGSAVTPLASFEDEKGSKFHFHNAGGRLLLLVPAKDEELSGTIVPELKYTVQFHFGIKHKIALSMLELGRKQEEFVFVHAN